MKRIIIVLQSVFIMGLLSCQISDKQTKLSSNIKIKNDTILQAIHPKPMQEQPSLLGVWRFEKDENPTFDIKNDSIFYIDQGETYKCSITQDSIIIYYDGWTCRGMYKVSHDTLIISDNNGDEKYVREAQ